MSTAILLISVDDEELLATSLPAAAAQPGAEVTVIDNACSDGTAALAGRHGARVLSLAERVSWAAASNAAIDATRSEHVLLLNADCFLEPGFLPAARAALAADGRAGSVAPKLIRTLGPAPHQRLDAIDCAGMWLDRRRKNGLVGHGEPALGRDRPGEAFGADGAAALWRREALEDCRLGGRVLDERMAAWASDVDLAWRARLLGWRCVYEPRAVAYHVRSYRPGTRSAMPARERRLQFRNRYLMMAKNDSAALVRDLPRIAAYELAALGWAALRERFLFAGYRDAARALPAALADRRELRARLRERPRVAVPFGLEPPR